MRVKLSAFDKGHFASNIVQNGELLKWDAQGNTHHLIIRGHFGKSLQLTEDDARTIEALGTQAVLSGKEHRYQGTRHGTFQAKGFVNNFALSTRPARYAVFACEFDEASDTCIIYLPNEACQYQCDVFSDISIRLEKEAVKKSLFGKRPEREYYVVHIPPIPGYEEGGLHYTFDGCRYRYPITKAMLGKAICIPAFGSKAPFIEGTSSGGYRIQMC
jgi:hypothetical protein